MTDAPRLLWIHQNFVSARQAGNVRSMYIVSAFLEAGWCVDIICSQRTYFGDRVGRGDSEVDVEHDGRLTIHRLRVPGRSHHRGVSYLQFGAKAVRYIARFSDARLVYCSSPPLPQAIVSVVAALRTGAPLHLELRDLWPAQVAEGGLLRSGVLIAVMEWLEAFLYRFADAFVVVAPSYRNYLEMMGVPRDRILIALTGADRFIQTVPRDLGLEWKRAAGLADRVVVLYSGSFNEPYDVSFLLSAARVMAKSRDDVVWVFAGNGRGRAEVERASRELPNVRYIGSVRKDDLLAVLIAADVAVTSHASWPLLEISIPGKLFDFLSVGAPVIVTREGQAALIVRAAGAGEVLESPSPIQLADLVGKLADLTPEERHSLGMSGQRWVSRMADAGAMARTVVAHADRFSARVTAGRRWRLLSLASVGATRDLVRRKGRRAIDATFRVNRMETVRHSFDAWVRAHALGKPLGSTLEVPVLLSDRCATPEHSGSDLSPEGGRSVVV